MKLKQFSLTIAALFVAASASAADPKLGIVYDAGGKFDKSFNQSAFEGATRFKKDTGIGFIEVQASSDTQAEQVLRALGRDGGEADRKTQTGVFIGACGAFQTGLGA